MKFPGPLILTSILAVAVFAAPVADAINSRDQVVRTTSRDSLNRYTHGAAYLTIREWEAELDSRKPKIRLPGFLKKAFGVVKKLVFRRAVEDEYEEHAARDFDAADAEEIDARIDTDFNMEGVVQRDLVKREPLFFGIAAKLLKKAVSLGTNHHRNKRDKRNKVKREIISRPTQSDSNGI